MGTSSSIVQVCNDGTYKVAYCSYDGYPAHVGAMLLRWYTDEDKVSKLIDKGWFPSIEADPNDIHITEEDPNDNIGYDGPVESRPGIYSSRKEALEFANSRDYTYIWENGKWFINSKKLIELTRDFCLYGTSKSKKRQPDPGAIEILNATEKPQTTRQGLADIHNAAVKRDTGNPRVFHFPNGVICGDFTPTKSTRVGTLERVDNLLHLREDDGTKWMLMQAVEATENLQTKVFTLINKRVEVTPFREFIGQMMFGDENALDITSISEV